MNAQLARAMIQRQYRGVTPPASITAPIADTLDRDHTTEADRLAQFDLSARFVGGRHPDPFNPLPVQQANALFAKRYAAEAAPGFDYDQDLRDGFALKYQEEA